LLPRFRRFKSLSYYHLFNELALQSAPLHRCVSAPSQHAGENQPSSVGCPPPNQSQLCRPSAARQHDATCGRSHVPGVSVLHVKGMGPSNPQRRTVRTTSSPRRTDRCKSCTTGRSMRCVRTHR
jgi:hypothetical protein